jgi:hypothetical protein
MASAKIVSSFLIVSNEPGSRKSYGRVSFCSGNSSHSSHLLVGHSVCELDIDSLGPSYSVEHPSRQHYDNTPSKRYQLPPNYSSC